MVVLIYFRLSIENIKKFNKIIKMINKILLQKKLKIVAKIYNKIKIKMKILINKMKIK